MAGGSPTLRVMDAKQRFVDLVSGLAEPPLDEASALIAACADHRVDVAAVLGELDHLAAGCSERTLDSLRHHLFDDVGFTGNRHDYYDPGNSLLNKVIERRMGIPITLSVVLMETARRIGVPLVGIGAPGHFLVRHGLDTDVFIDAFNGGLVFDRAAAGRLIEQVQPGGSSGEALEEVPTRVILGRMLANLKGIYLQRSDAIALAWVLELRVALPGASESEVQELAKVRAHFN
jgi:regulator of sirC expression with transglutaminase-like and TPR domain